MRIRVLTLVATLLATAAPLGSRAQQGRYEADFPVVRAAYLRNDVRQAAQTLLMAAAHLREEVGRVKEADIGNRLLAAESRLEALAQQVRAGGVSGVAALDAAFAAADRLLAEHHARLAVWSVANLRQVTAPQLGHDIEAAAAHHVRAAHEAGRALDAPAQQLLADAQRLAGQLATRTEPPTKELVEPTIVALGRLLVPPGDAKP
jgi:hypothetical protein